MSILSTEIDVCKILLAVKSRTDTFSLEINLKICTIVYDNVQGVVELLDLICIANNVNHFVFVWLKHTVSLDNFPNAFFIFSKSGVLSVDLRLVANLYLFSVITKDFHVVIVNLCSVDCNDGAN